MTYLFISPLLALAAAILLAPAPLIAQLPASNGAAPAWGQSAVPSAYRPAVPGAQPGGPYAAAPVPGTQVAAPPLPNSEDHILMPGDLIDVKVFQEPDLESILRIAQDGGVVFPLIGRVTVGGLTPLAAAKVIQSLLDKDYIVNPQVTLLVTEYAVRTYTVLGEVQKPGSYQMPDRSNVSLLEAIGMAGGYTRLANASAVTVKRKVNDQESIFHLNAKRMAAGRGENASFEIQAGDVITVAESIF